MDEETVAMLLNTMPVEKHEQFLKCVAIANAITDAAKQTIAIFEEQRLAQCN